MNLPNRDELSLRSVIAFPKDSNSGFTDKTNSSSFVEYRNPLEGDVKDK